MFLPRQFVSKSHTRHHVFPEKMLGGFEKSVEARANYNNNITGCVRVYQNILF